MWIISTEAHFSAAHQLRGYPGECREVHGHNFRVKIAIQTSELKDLGFGMDFRELKQMLRDVIKKLDHRNLNEFPEFKEVNPTAENIAKYIWDSLNSKLKTQDSKLKEVQVWESDTNSVIYYEGE
ncbi:6-carboxytetrahydropterin synthase QueD [candidate division WOR-3 bacterium]|nr:6-carboxytetrahydropterin synthase QueD [candidate division WOR-3 bacterium]